MPGIEHQTFPRLPYRLLSLRVHPGYGALTSGRAPRRDFREFRSSRATTVTSAPRASSASNNRAAKPAATAGSDDRPAIHAERSVRRLDTRRPHVAQRRWLSPVCFFLYANALGHIKICNRHRFGLGGEHLDPGFAADCKRRCALVFRVGKQCRYVVAVIPRVERLAEPSEERLRGHAFLAGIGFGRGVAELG